MKYLEKLEQIPKNQRVYIDESGCNEHYQRDYARALRGVKVEDIKRGRKFGRTNVIAAYCNNEILVGKTYKINTNSQFFEDWFEFDLLSIIPCGYTIIMDRASFHRKKKLLEIAERYSVNLLFLPAYSPDFNPIEKFWANMKKWLSNNIQKYTTLSIAIWKFLVRFLN